MPVMVKGEVNENSIDVKVNVEANNVNVDVNGFDVNFAGNIREVSVGGIDIDVDTGSDKVSVMKDITIDKPVFGDVVAVMGDIDINSNVNGDVIAVMGNITINGQVFGSVITVLGNVTLSGNAHVNGDVISLGTIERHDNAVVFGEETGIDVKFVTPSAIALVVVKVILACITFVAALVIVAIFNKRYTLMSNNIEVNLGKKIGIGLLAFIAFVLLSVILSVTVIAPLFSALIMAAMIAASSTYFGKVILKSFRRDFGVFTQFFVGFLFINLVQAAVLGMTPQLGFATGAIIYLVFALFINSLGAGILVESKFGSKSYVE